MLSGHVFTYGTAGSDLVRLGYLLPLPLKEQKAEVEEERNDLGGSNPIGWGKGRSRTPEPSPGFLEPKAKLDIGMPELGINALFRSESTIQGSVC